MRKISMLPVSILLSVMVVCGFCAGMNAYAGDAPDPNKTSVSSDAAAAYDAKLTGDWGSARTKLADNGITIDIDAVQAFQGIIDGGKDHGPRYGGSMDYRFKFDFQKMGLWQGAFLDVQFEHQFGEFVNGDTGAMLGSNIDGVMPLPDYRHVNVSEFKFTQFLSESFAVFFGKINTFDGDDNVFAGGRGKTNFMHQNFIFNPVSMRTVPYSALGAGAAVFFPSATAKDPAILSFLVLGANGQPNTIGFGKDFDDGQTFAVGYRQPTNFFDQSGSHTFGGSYGTKEYTLLSQDPRLFILDMLGFPVTYAKDDDSWSLTYNMHQYLYTEADDKTQGFGVFGRFGTADADTNPIENFYSVGLGGKGTVDGRDNDTWGIGYFYAQLSDRFGKIIERYFGDTQGLELFYNIEVTKWLHLTPDLQIIDPSNKHVDTAYVAGFRAKIDF